MSPVSHTVWSSTANDQTKVNSVNARRSKRDTSVIGSLFEWSMNSAPPSSLSTISRTKERHRNFTIRIFLLHKNSSGSFRWQLSLWANYDVPEAVSDSGVSKMISSGYQLLRARLSEPVMAHNFWFFQAYILGPYTPGLSQGRPIVVLIFPTHHPFFSPSWLLMLGGGVRVSSRL
jgi:hypothetical protein